MYEDIKRAQDAGTAEIKLESGVVVQEIPVAESQERLIVTSKRYDPITGQEVQPVVQNVYKRDLINEKNGLIARKKGIDEQIAVIDELLAQFVVAAPVVEEKLF